MARLLLLLLLMCSAHTATTSSQDLCDDSQPGYATQAPWCSPSCQKLVVVNTVLVVTTVAASVAMFVLVPNVGVLEGIVLEPHDEDDP